MTESIFSSTLLTIALPFITASSSVPIQSGSAIPQTPPLSYPAVQQEFIHVVKEEESLSSIAFEYYDSEEYWTTIWNDNPELTDKNVISEGMKLTIRADKPLLIEEPELHTYTEGEFTITTGFEITPQSEMTFTITPTVYVLPSLTPTPIQSGPTAPVQIVTPTSAPVITTGASGPLNDAQITFLGTCESGMTATRNSGNGFYGAFQFMPSTWRAMGTGYERADYAPLDVQIAAVQKLLSRSSIWTQFPGCAKKMQLAGLL